MGTVVTILLGVFQNTDPVEHLASTVLETGSPIVVGGTTQQAIEKGQMRDGYTIPRASTVFSAY